MTEVGYHDKRVRKEDKRKTPDKILNALRGRGVGVVSVDDFCQAETVPPLVVVREGETDEQDFRNLAECAEQHPESIFYFVTEPKVHVVGQPFADRGNVFYGNEEEIVRLIEDNKLNL